MSLGSQSSILKASDDLQASLTGIGNKEHFLAGAMLFREDADNAGVFLVTKGKVSLSVASLPKLDRLFGSGSVLGLPSSFTGRPYSLSATAVSDAEAVHVSPADFVKLMRERTELCREATEMLGREVTFIQAALAERRRQGASAKLSTGVALM